MLTHCLAHRCPSLINWYLTQHHGQLHCLSKLSLLVSWTSSHILSKRKHRRLITTHLQHRRVTVYGVLQTEEVVTVPSLRASLVEFVASAASEVQYEMLKVFLAGIKHHHQLARMPDTVATTIRLPLVLRGIRRRGLRLPPKPHLPITIKIIGQMKSTLLEHLDRSNNDRQMYWATFTTAFFGFLWCLEFTTPSVSNCDKDQTLLHSDLTNNGNGYRLHINAATMDPFRLGVNLFLRRTHHSVCPVKTFKNYLTRPRESDLPQLHTQMSPFSLPCVLPLSFGLCYTNWGTTKTTTCHSFWMEAATTAAAADLPDWLIKTLGRWSSHCYQRYIQLNGKVLSSVANVLAKAHIPTNFPSWFSD